MIPFDKSKEDLEQMLLEIKPEVNSKFEFIKVLDLYKHINFNLWRSGINQHYNTSKVSYDVTDIMTGYGWRKSQKRIVSGKNPIMVWWRDASDKINNGTPGSPESN